MFYLICKSNEDRNGLIKHLKHNSIRAVFHYLSLHKSPFYKDKHDKRVLVNSDLFTETLVRLPLFYELSEEQQHRVISNIISFFKA